MTDEPSDDGPTAGKAGPRVTAATAAGQAARQTRLAGALRDNLQRRKAQARARRPMPDEPPGDAG
jgi:hypothetical protein